MKTTVKRIAAVVLAGFLFIGGCEFWKYILINDSTSYTRIMMHQLYHPSANIDVLFVGSSHAYRALIPEIMDRELGAYTFNGGSSKQYLDGSFALIKEADKGNDLKQVCVELYYDIAETEPYAERTELTPTYILADYMPMSLNKIQYLTKASANKHWINSFLIARRNWRYFFDSSYMKDTILAKQTTQYREFIYPVKEGDTEYYADRGFVACDSDVSPKKHFNYKAYGQIPLEKKISKDSDWYRSLTDIVDYCQTHEIGITFFISPEPEWTLAGKGNYQDYHDFISAAALEHQIEFYDFNLCRNEYFDTDDRSLFKDEQHLNTKGAEQFSDLFGKILSGHLSEKEVLYDSFPEKIAARDIPFYGISGPVSTGDGKMLCEIITGSDHYEFQVMEIKDDGTQKILLDFNEGTAFTMED